jgi:Holliday junction resolvase-like predicted endonuclease
MPAIDKCEENIIKALEKEGWDVLDKPYQIKFAKKRYVYADLGLINRDNEKIIIVEVKCFPSAPLDSFYGAVGQYISYRLMLKRDLIDSEIF